MSNDAKEEKKVWQKPELVILARSTPEEAVLVACKFGSSMLGPAGACPSTGCNTNKSS